MSLASLVLLTWCGVACTQANPSPVLNWVTVDYIRIGPQGTIRVLLDSRGASRVDLADKVGANRRCFLIPTNEAEVQRVATCIAALVEVTGEDCHLDVSEPRLPFAQFMSIAFTHRGRSGNIKIKSNEEMQDHLWKGVVEEIEAVGLVTLAIAFDEFVRGEDLAMEASGDKKQAIALLEEATSSFQSWARSRYTRYGGGIFEPEVSMEFHYLSSQNGEYMVLKGLPKRIMELPGMTAEWAIKALQYGWKEYTGGLAVRRSHGATIIIPVEQSEKNAWTWGLSRSNIPKDLFHALLAAPWPAVQ